MVFLEQFFCKAAFVSSLSSSFLRSKAQLRATSNRHKSTMAAIGKKPSLMAVSMGFENVEMIG